MKLGIIGAMTVEVETLKSMLTDATQTERAGMEFCSGKLQGLDVVIAQCGVGKVNAALCVQIMCDVFSVTGIVNTGVAGSLEPQLDIGDLVVSRDAMYHDFDCHTLNPDYPVGQVPGMAVHAYPADEVLIRYARNAAEETADSKVWVGRVASGDQFVCDSEVKNKIIADTGAVCTEMEGAAIAHAAWRNGVPFVVIRAISDKADNSAEMDYPTFEAIAAKRCAAVTAHMAKSLANM